MKTGHPSSDLRRASEKYLALQASSPAESLVQEIDFQQVESEEKIGELALQAKFYSGEFGDRWVTLCGKEVRLLDPGAWNREAGPDFRGVTVLVDGGEKLHGDLEMDLHSSGWEQHGHATNPAFGEVVLHFFFHEGQKRVFARNFRNESVMQVRLSQRWEKGESGGGEIFSPEPIGSPADALQLIRLAAMHRLQAKAKAAATSVRLHGKKTAIFQGVARALGYKDNIIPLSLLAQRSGWKTASSALGEPYLFGLAGFLSGEDFDFASGDTRRYLCGLWEEWWKIRDAENRLVLPPEAWKFSGIRPANHPHRRVAALRGVAQETGPLTDAVERGDLAAFENCLLRIKHPFWGRHWNLKGGELPLGKEVALIGKNRIADIAANLFVPLLAEEKEDAFSLWEKIRPGQTPAKVLDYSAWLCPSLPEKSLVSAAVQQGILQLGNDFRGKESPRSLLARYLNR